MAPIRCPRRCHRQWLGLFLVCLAAVSNLAWSGKTTRHVAWRAVEFFPSDLARLVRRHHRRYDAGIERGLRVPPAWRAGPPGRLADAIEAQAERCVVSLRRPVPLDDLVEELGVLAVHAIDANDPLAVAHADPREPLYASAYLQYADAIRYRVRLVYYGQDRELIYQRRLAGTVAAILDRSRKLYPFVGQEFFRQGALRDWHTFDDRSVAFGVAAISLSRGMTDLVNLATFVWHGGGGLVPTPRPIVAEQDQTITVLGGGFLGQVDSQGKRPVETAGALRRGSGERRE